MEDKETLEIFKANGALMIGHFQLTSGLHSFQYLQPALALQHPPEAGKLGDLLAARFKEQKIALVVTMDIGGIVLTREIARTLGARAVFAEREAGAVTLNHEVTPGEKVLLVEEIVQSDGSAKALIEALTAAGADVVGIGTLVNPRGNHADAGVPRISLLSFTVSAVDPADCTVCRNEYSQSP